MSIAQPPPPSLLPFSPLASPTPDQSSFPTDVTTSMDNRPLSGQALTYAPFRSSPLATTSTTATIRHISETGEMEMDDPEEEMDVDSDDVFTMDDLETIGPDDEIQDIRYGETGSVQVDEGLFRAGTPTPVILPFTRFTHAETLTTNNSQDTPNSFNRRLLAVGLGNASDSTPEEEFREAAQLFSVDDPYEVPLMEDVALLEEMIEASHEISTEELDTECITSPR